MFLFIIEILALICGFAGVVLLIASVFHIFLDTFFPIDEVEIENE